MPKQYLMVFPSFGIRVMLNRKGFDNFNARNTSDQAITQTKANEAIYDQKQAFKGIILFLSFLILKSR